MKTHRNDLTIGGLGGILTGIESVKEIGQMSKHPTNYPTSELKKLKSLAKAATPGPWSHEPTSFNKLDRILFSGRSRAAHGLNLMTLGDGDWNHVNNVEFIAAANPHAILSLVEHIEAQAARIAELEGALKPFAGAANYLAAWVPEDESHWPGECKMPLASDLRRARQAYTGDTTTDITSHESTAPYAHPYAGAVKGDRHD